MKKTVFLALLATAAAAVAASAPASAAAFTTDELRAELALRHAGEQRAAALQPAARQDQREIRVVDTDSARAAAAQEHREQRLLAEHAVHSKLQAHAAMAGSPASSR